MANGLAGPQVKPLGHGEVDSSGAAPRIPSSGAAPRIPGDDRAYLGFATAIPGSSGSMGVLRGLARAVGGLLAGVGGLLSGLASGVGRFLRRLF